jgi:hypothetical protein
MCKRTKLSMKAFLQEFWINPIGWWRDVEIQSEGVLVFIVYHHLRLILPSFSHTLALAHSLLFSLSSYCCRAHLTTWTIKYSLSFLIIKRRKKILSELGVNLAIISGKCQIIISRSNAFTYHGISVLDNALSNKPVFVQKIIFWNFHLYIKW